MLLPLFTSSKLHRLPYVVALLLVSNVVIFLFTRQSLDTIAPRWGFTPPGTDDSWEAWLSGGASLETAVTYAFLHAGWGHLIGNLWILFVFGIALESRVGSIRFATIYMAFAILAILAHAVMQADPTRPVIGASGAISGVLGCYLATEPRSRVLSIFFLGIIFFLTEIPSLFYGAIWLILQIDGVQTQLLTGPQYRNIAWWAHIGGFAAGVALGIVTNLLAKNQGERLESP